MTSSTDSPPEAATSTPDGLVQRVVRWLRAGYPEGVPQQDYVALLGILRRTLTDTELDRVVGDLTEDAEADRAIMTRQLVEQRVADVVKGPAHDDDLVRVSARLAAAGWPLGVPGAEDPTQGDEPGGLVSRVVGWLRAGYPSGLPERDFSPLVALLHRRLTDDEVRAVARGLVDAGLVSGARADLGVDIGVGVAAVTAELPSEEDVERVRAYLESHGWPSDQMP